MNVLLVTHCTYQNETWTIVCPLKAPSFGCEQLLNHPYETCGYWTHVCRKTSAFGFFLAMASATDNYSEGGSHEGEALFWKTIVTSANCLKNKNDPEAKAASKGLIKNLSWCLELIFTT